MNAMDCWTFFEIALGFARMLDEPEANWTSERMLHYIELDRYRGGNARAITSRGCIISRSGFRITIAAG